MKNLITQILIKFLTQALSLEKFAIVYRSFALALTLPITLNGSFPITFELVKLQDAQPKVEIRSEKLTKIAFNAKNPQVLILVEKQVEIKPVESTFEKEQRLAKETERIVLESQKLAQRDVVVREKVRFTVAPDLAQKRVLTQAAASKYGIPWQILEAVWQVESGKSWDTNRKSYAGATGPMQFLPSTFRKYAGAGASIYRASDSVYAAANLLACAGASSGQVEKALFAYNHSQSYVQKVLKVARSIGY